MSEDERLVSVRRVPDETTATLLCDFLKTNGVTATAVAMQIPWLPGVETFRQGYWGHVEVLEHDADRARALIADFYEAEPQQEPGHERGGNGFDHEDGDDDEDDDDDDDDEDGDEDDDDEDDEDEDEDEEAQ
jgi:hypothetical protein